MFSTEFSYPFEDSGRGGLKHFCDGVHGKSMAIEKDRKRFLCKGPASICMVFCPLIGTVFTLIALFFVDEPIFDEV